MKKSFLKSIAFCLCFVSVALMFSGCNKQIDGNKVDILYQSGRKDMIVDSSSNIDCDYLLVYHDTSAYSDIDAYIDFLEQLSLKATTLTFQLCPDSLIVPNEKQKIILLGSTNYSESKSASDLINTIRPNNYYDYLLRTNNNVLAVSWVSKFGREEAFNYILETVLKNGLSKVFNKEYSRLYLSSRSDAPVVTINDVNVIQYSVVIPSAPSYVERDAANKLVAAIKDATGVELPIVTDKTEETTFEILIGDTNRGATYTTNFFADNRFAIAQYATKLILRGGHTKATSTAVSLFTQSILNAHITAAPLHLKSGYYLTGNTDKYNMEMVDGYELAFAEEFNSKEINSTIWNIQDNGIPTYGLAPSILTFDPENVRADGKGALLSTHLGSGGYHTGAIDTHGKLSLQYGYVELRARFKTAPSYWVSAKLINQFDKNKNVSQIDIFNSMFNPEMIFASAGVLAYDDYYRYYLDLNTPSYDAYRDLGLKDDQIIDYYEFHTYGVEWTDKYIRYFFDGVPYGTVEITSSKFDELKKELYLELSATVEMFDQETDDEAAQWPVDYEIDWLRIYQKPGVGTLNLHPNTAENAEASK